MRIVAGSKKGHRISAPKGVVTRPTGDRVREAVFNIVGPVEGARVLDVFAGSGAMGLEALSRGAARAVFVERDRDACRVIQQNLEKLRLTGAVVLCQDAVGALREEKRSRPHDTTSSSWTRRTRNGTASKSRLPSSLPTLLEEDGLVVVETGAKVEPELPLALVTSRRYGSARITVFSR